MYEVRQTLEVIQHPVEDVYNEALSTEHIPRELGPVHLTCPDDRLREGSYIISSLGISFLRFKYKVEVTDLVENELLRMQGEDSNARVDIQIALRGLQRQRATAVDVNLSLETISSKAQKAEKLFGGKQKTDCISQGIMSDIFGSVVGSLDSQAEHRRLSA